MSPPAAALTCASPLALRLRAWANERFPAVNVTLFAAVYLVAVLGGRALTARGPLDLRAADLLAFAGAWAFFLLLRVLDEHKDFARDARAHPGRVLQRGLVTLDQLKLFGAAAVATQLAVSLIADHGVGRATLWWAATMAWTALMAKEFFAGAWLERRLVVYAVSHMLVMPLAMLWWAQVGAGATALPLSTAWIAVVGFLVGAAAEVARKLRAPEQERDEVDSYTKALGIAGAVDVLALLLCCTVLVGALLLRASGAGATLAYLALAGSVAPALAAAARFRTSPSPRAASRVELATGASVVVLLIALAAAILAARGIA
jgi:4-hydroxybenzoate polyprenyltransferase